MIGSDDLNGFSYKISRFNRTVGNHRKADPQAKKDVAELWGVADVLVRNVIPLAKSVNLRPQKSANHGGRSTQKSMMSSDDLKALRGKVSHLNQIMCTEMMIDHGKADPKAKEDVAHLWDVTDKFMKNVDSLANSVYKEPLTRDRVVDMMLNNVDDDPF